LSPWWSDDELGGAVDVEVVGHSGSSGATGLSSVPGGGAKLSGAATPFSPVATIAWIDYRDVGQVFGHEGELAHPARVSIRTSPRSIPAAVL
jgi:hypothetical protein